MHGMNNEGPGALAHGELVSVTLQWYSGQYWTTSESPRPFYLFECIGSNASHNRWHVDNIRSIASLPQMTKGEWQGLLRAW